MRVLSELLLGALFRFGDALMALFVVLLRSFPLHFVKLQGEKLFLEIEPYAGSGQMERIKRPAFLSGIQN